MRNYFLTKRFRKRKNEFRKKNGINVNLYISIWKGGKYERKK